MTEAATSSSTVGTRPTVRAFRAVAVLEAVSWLVLIGATVVKYATTPHKQLGVQIVGPVHGALFVAYVVLALLVMRRVGWNVRTAGIVLLDSILPFGGFIVARRADLR